MLIKKKCKIERSLGQRLFLKGERCNSPKCAAVRRPYRPGLQGKSKKRSRVKSEFGRQLSDKQKLKLTYVISERQLQKYFNAVKVKANVPEQLLKKIESRLDNVVFRLGLASSRMNARQMVSHGHILVNDRGVNVPSYEVKKGDELAIKENIIEKILSPELKLKLKKYESPVWLVLNKDKDMKGKMISEPTIDELKNNFNLKSIIEYYSR